MSRDWMNKWGEYIDFDLERKPLMWKEVNAKIRWTHEPMNPWTQKKSADSHEPADEELVNIKKELN